MQVIFENKNERNDGRRTSGVGVDICTERINRHLEIKYIRRFENKSIRV